MAADNKVSTLSKPMLLNIVDIRLDSPDVSHSSDHYKFGWTYGSQESPGAARLWLACLQHESDNQLWISSLLLVGMPVMVACFALPICCLAGFWMYQYQLYLHPAQSTPFSPKQTQQPHPTLDAGTEQHFGAVTVSHDRSADRGRLRHNNDICMSGSNEQEGRSPYAMQHPQVKQSSCLSSSVRLIHQLTKLIMSLTPANASAANV